MEKFAFIIHPLTVQDVSRKFPVAKHLPGGVIERVLQYVPPFTVSHITGVASPSATGEGWFVACPLTSQQMLSLPEKFVDHYPNLNSI